MIMAKRVSKSNSNKFFVDKFTHPQNIAVMKTRAEPLHIDIVIGHPDEILDDNQYFGAIFQYPGTFGDIETFQIIFLHFTEIMQLQLCQQIHLPYNSKGSWLNGC